jgi:hypothetical protein
VPKPLNHCFHHLFFSFQTFFDESPSNIWFLIVFLPDLRQNAKESPEIRKELKHSSLAIIAHTVMANQESKLPTKAPETINNVAKLSDTIDGHF